MPRIDPIELLKCLSVLLSPTGGIKSEVELARLSRLMTNFSKKLVSKCIYIQILKCTEADLLKVFMASGGWRLVHMWLTESIVTKNWPLTRELLELLLLCRVDIGRLKTNNCPKLVKELSREGNVLAIRALALKLVEQWLKTVKGETVDPIRIEDLPQIIEDFIKLYNEETSKEPPKIKEDIKIESEDKSQLTVKQEEIKEVKIENIEKEEKAVPIASNNNRLNEQEQETLPVLKITVKDGKQIISRVDDPDDKIDKADNQKPKLKDKSEKSTSNSSKSSSSKHSSKSSSDSKHKSSNSHKSSSSSSSISSHHSKDKSRDKDRRSSHSSSSKSSKHSENRKSHEKSSSSSSKSSSSSNKDEKSKSSKDKIKEKDKVKEKDDKVKEKDTKSKDSEPKIDKDSVPSIHKLGKIPKLSDVKKEKPSISIEVRKPDEPKPKTVKTFHSKFRSHGLEEEIKPPPSRASLLNKKLPPVLPPTVAIPKRPSPSHNDPPPEKKPKIIEPVEKPGAIKLIPPKPKPMMLLESDMFMDALNASATTTKKEPKKRKRRTSGSKDGNPSEGSPTHSSNTFVSENKSVPPKFYQDTLEVDEDKEKSFEKDSDSENGEIDSKNTIKEEEHLTDPHTLTVNGLKGVLCYHKRKGPKKSIKWKPDSELEEVQYFELDETERVNVTKTFTDMKHLERINEREAFEKARNLSNDDVMEEKTNWRPLILLDTEGQIPVDYGKLSKEKDIQAIRQKGTLQALYFHRSMVPDSPHEPEPETHPYSEPSIILLEDITGNPDNISDYRNMPWPDAKGNAPPAPAANINVPPLFTTNIGQFPSGFPGAQFPSGIPGFQAPNLPQGLNSVPPMMGSPMPPGSMPPNSMPPGLLVPPDGMMMGPDMFGAPHNPMFGPVPPDAFMMDNMMGPNMFPPDFNINGPQGPPLNEGFPVGGPFRGAMRGRGVGGNWRSKGPGNWDGPYRGRGGPSRGRKAVCIYFQKKGSCRQGENCTFLHPGVNCPF